MLEGIIIVYLIAFPASYYLSRSCERGVEALGSEIYALRIRVHSFRAINCPYFYLSARGLTERSIERSNRRKLCHLSRRKGRTFSNQESGCQFESFGWPVFRNITQSLECILRQRGLRHVNRGKRRNGKLRKRYVVKTDHGEILRNQEPTIRRLGNHSHSCQVVRAKDC